jgi:hypothetical protein
MAYFAKKVINDVRRRDKVHKFESYMTLLHYHMEKAYDIIHKEQLLIYSIEATKVGDKEFNKAAADFALLTRKMLGPKLTSEFVDLYGDEDTFVFNMVEFFNTKYESDEIREGAVNAMMDSEDEEEIKYGEQRQRNINVVGL